MTEEKAILNQIQQLSEQLKQEVLHYAEFLQKKYAAQNRKNKDRKAGSAKGKYKLAPKHERIKQASKCSPTTTKKLEIPSNIVLFSLSNISYNLI